MLCVLCGLCDKEPFLQWSLHFCLNAPESADGEGRPEMKGIGSPLRETVNQVLDELPPEQIAEILDFALFLKHRTQPQGWPQKPQWRAIPATHLDGLVGLVAWGGDALADTEGLYEV
jgi:hypothetical protein